MNLNKENRRSFLKKAAYVAPVVLAMGPLSAHAEDPKSSRIFTNPVIKQTVQGTENNTITITNPNKPSVTITVSPTGKLTNFSKFLRK
jgi:hypothetical protein